MSEISAKKMFISVYPVRPFKCSSFYPKFDGQKLGFFTLSYRPILLYLSPSIFHIAVLFGQIFCSLSTQMGPQDSDPQRLMLLLVGRVIIFCRQ